MIDTHIRKTKIHFSVGLFLLLATLISGITTFKSVPYFTYEYFVKELNYIKYKYIVSTSDISIGATDEEAKAASVPVLVYHGLIKDGANNSGGQSGEGINITPDIFFNQMFALKKAGWNTVSIYDFNDFMQGKKSLPARSFLLTFDDGRRDSYYPADPILRALNFQATMFVITGRSLDSSKESSFYLSESELKGMVKSGRWEMQSHGKMDHDLYEIDSEQTKGHFLANKLWDSQESRLETDEDFSSRIRTDLTDSKNDIEQRLDVDVIGFAYPFSDRGDQSSNFSNAEAMLSEATKSIYPLAFYQVSSKNGSGFNYPFRDNEDSFLVKRIKFSSPLDGDDLVQYLTISSPKKLPYQDSFDLDSGWHGTWGRVAVDGGVLSVGASDSTSGGAVFLDGSQRWSDYSLTIIPERIDGESITLLTRYSDEKNFVECTYSDKYARLTEYLSGEKKVLGEVKTQHPLSQSKSMAAEVTGDSAQCIIDNTVLVSGTVNHGLSDGMIGVKTWDGEIGKSRLEIESLTVESR